MAELPVQPKEAAERLLAGMTQHEASDLHLKVGYSPFYRIAGHLRKLDMTPFPDSDYIENMMKGMVSESRWREFVERGSLDFSAKGAGGDRYRVNLFRCTGETHASIRRVQKQGGNPDAGKSGGYFFADQTRFADAGHHHMPLALIQQVHHLNECIV